MAHQVYHFEEDVFWYVRGAVHGFDPDYLAVHAQLDPSLLASVATWRTFHHGCERLRVHAHTGDVTVCFAAPLSGRLLLHDLRDIADTPDADEP